MSNSLLHLQHRNLIRTFAVEVMSIDLALYVQDLVKAQICATGAKSVRMVMLIH